MTTTFRFQPRPEPITLQMVQDRIPANPRHPVPEPGLRLIQINHGPTPGVPILAFTDEGGTSFARLTVQSGVVEGRLTRPRLELTLHGASDSRHGAEILTSLGVAGFGEAHPVFADQEAAFAWLHERVDDPCVDNHRIAPLDDLVAMTGYSDQRDEGCCGFADYHVYVGERLHALGCNYGH